MKDTPIISIIIPYGYFTPDLEKTLQATNSQSCQIEIIIVTNRELKKDLKGLIHNVHSIVESNEKGRGYFCKAGALKARGSILLFLHADTILPDLWSQKIVDTMADPRVAGGGFTTTFRSDHWFVKRISKLYNLFSKLIREFWGDRAIFMRKKLLHPELNKINIPIMEDVEMSKIIRRNGELILLPDAVSTSALHFNIKGYFRHIAQVIYYRLLYACGVSSERIYQKYYRSFDTLKS